MSFAKLGTPIRKLLAAVAIVGMLASGIGIASFVIFRGSEQQQVEAPRRTPPKPPPPSIPTAKEFLVGVVVTAQNCEPADRCAYTYTIDPKYVGLHPFPETPFTVEYEVTGGFEPQPGTFTVTGQSAEILQGVTVEGPPGAALEANVLRIHESPPPPPPS
ncbi:hypothetical protein NGTWS1702_34620 [Mycolicibacterium cyprinidarum]|uniref:Uncharacterized protein n=1 Tax=Mycolicibacterium cyprinidarum TaxID=2860311 RepID=A0ABQ4V8P5_9MYCO|nr:hypothetical protein NGTWS1702_34620 [Mycolicibacterium sp. NGTWSNA01]